MKLTFVEEVSPKLKCVSEDEMHCITCDENIFVFPLTQRYAKKRSAKMSLVLYLKRIYILFALANESKN